MQFTVDPRKDTANIEKHGLSLNDAKLVFNAPNKLTLESPKFDEARLMDVALVNIAPMNMALVDVAGVVLVLVYVMRNPGEVRAISLRRASRQERTLYAASNR